MERKGERRSCRGGVVASFLVVLIIISSSLIEEGQSKPLGFDMEPIDVCIFTCDFCFQGEALVKCANECIMLEGVMGPLWRKTCPFFDKQAIFSTNKRSVLK